MTRAALAYLAIVNAAGIAGCAYLVTHDSPWWAGLVLLLSVGQSVKIEGGEK